MIYRYEITTPASTPETAKQQTILKLSPGVIHHIEIHFPPGPRGTLHLVIMRGLTQIWPSNPDEDFAEDNVLISYQEFYELLYPPYFLIAYTWNDSATYNHTVVIRIGVLKRKYVLRRLL